ncbi:response regulator [Paenibacillus sp. PR3]|uniref:Response regulator n=1 Tax=Paenibacillus terricola TaxID=2763503 RepID=A0ABR8MSM4_9BACL|nr:response regulator [Paenibacillus terricola]MBD3918983.1 response regulator [Paenibacillus terricola]
MLTTIIAITAIAVIAGIALLVRARQHRRIPSENASESDNLIATNEAHKEEEPHPTGVTPIVPAHLDKPSVLLVDDHPLMRQLMTEVLTQTGIGVVSAGSSQEALELLLQYRVDLVLTDVQMPGMDGIELLRRLRSMKGSPNASIPCVFVTGSMDDSKRREAERLGALAFFTKPFDIQAIGQFIAKHLEQDQLFVSP